MAAIDSKTCEAVQRGMERRFEGVEMTVKSHGEDITDLKVIVAKLTQIQESQEATGKFWGSAQGRWIIIGGIILLIMLTSAAIGQNLLGGDLAKFFTTQVK